MAEQARSEPRAIASDAVGGPRARDASAGHRVDAVGHSVLDDEVRAALAASHLGGLPHELIDKVAAEARAVDIPAGATIHHAGETNSHLELVVRGLVRVHVSAPDGRTMTVRYCRRGALIGAATLFAVGTPRQFSVQALSNSQLVTLRAPTVRHLADYDVRVARALLDETSERVLAFVAELSGSAFATTRARVARHLLDLASQRQRGPELIAPITQQEVADAIGSVREVVVRVLRELREDGVVRTGRHGITITDPERLFLVAVAQGGTSVPDRTRKRQ